MSLFEACVVYVNLSIQKKENTVTLATKHIFFPRFTLSMVL